MAVGESEPAVTCDVVMGVHRLILRAPSLSTGAPDGGVASSLVSVGDSVSELDPDHQDCFLIRGNELHTR